MSSEWISINGDNLSLSGEAVAFLQGEFCPLDVDDIWSTEYFQWKIGSGNPAGPGFLSLAILDDKVVGVVSLTKKRVLINGLELIAGEVGDTYTSAAIRMRGKPAILSPIDSDPASFINRSVFGRLATELRVRAEACGIGIIYGTPNSNAYPGWTKRLSYFDFQAYSNYSFTRPTWRMLIRRHPFFSCAKYVLQLMENTLISAQVKICNAKNSSLLFEFEKPTEKQVNELWARIRPSKGFSLVRDFIYWRHRYLDHPLAKYNFCCIYRKGSLVGMAVVRLTMTTGEIPILFIVEWMLEDDVPFNYLLTNILQACKAWKIDAFKFWANGSGREGGLAWKNLFLKRSRVPIILFDSIAGRSLEKMSSDSFCFHMGSTDAI